MTKRALGPEDFPSRRIHPLERGGNRPGKMGFCVHTRRSHEEPLPIYRPSDICYACPGPEVMQMEMAEAAEKLRTTLRVLSSFRSMYQSYKARSLTAQPNNPWRFQGSAMFGRLDAFSARCATLLDFCQTSLQFGRLERVEIGGTKVQAFFSPSASLASTNMNLYPSGLVTKEGQWGPKTFGAQCATLLDFCHMSLHFGRLERVEIGGLRAGTSTHSVPVSFSG